MMRLDADQVLRMHRMLIEKTGGVKGLLHESMLLSALNAPFQTFDGVELYPSLEEKAAKLCFFLISNHAFADGNKRLGIFVMLVFLELNGVVLDATQQGLIDLGLGLAGGALREADVLRFIRAHKKRPER